MHTNYVYFIKLHQSLWGSWCTKWRLNIYLQYFFFLLWVSTRKTAYFWGSKSIHILVYLYKLKSSIYCNAVTKSVLTRRKKLKKKMRKMGKITEKWERMRKRASLVLSRLSMLRVWLCPMRLRKKASFPSFSMFTLRTNT